MSPRDLPSLWRSKASEIDPYAPAAARAFSDAADELERALSQWEAALITLERAMEESGYSRKQLMRLREEGKLTWEEDESGSPLFIRSELPRHANKIDRKPTVTVSSRTEGIHSIIGEYNGKAK